MVEISVKSSKADTSVIFEKELGSNLEEACAIFGAEEVFGLYLASATLKAQTAARNVLNNGGSEAEAIQTGASWVPGQRTVGTPNKSTIVKRIEKAYRDGTMSREDVQGILEELQNQLEPEADSEVDGEENAE